MKFNFHPRFRGQGFAEMTEQLAVAPSVEKTVAADADVELEVVVGLVSARARQHSTFAAPVAAAEHDRLQTVLGNDFFDGGSNAFACSRETPFEGWAAILGETDFRTLYRRSHAGRRRGQRFEITECVHSRAGIAP